MICLRLQKSNKRFYMSWGTFSSFCWLRVERMEWGFEFFHLGISLDSEVATILAFAQPQPCTWCFRVWILDKDDGKVTDLTYKSRFVFWKTRLGDVGRKSTTRCYNLVQLNFFVRFFQLNSPGNDHICPPQKHQLEVT